MTLPEIVTYIEMQFPVKEGQPCSVSQTGEDYTQLYSSGVAQEGSACQLYPSEKQALAAYKASFDEYASSRKGTLYWRIRPELTEIPEKGWSVYSRLLITDKDELPEGHDLLLATHQKFKKLSSPWPLADEIEFGDAMMMAIWYCKHLGLNPHADVFCGEPAPVHKKLPGCYHWPASTLRSPLWRCFINEGYALVYAASGRIKFDKDALND
jgi:hypothetical protein